MATVKRVLNRKIPHALPHRMMLQRDTGAFPSAVDLRASDGPMKDQKTTGCCTGESKSSTFEWIVRRYFAHLGPLVFSPMFSYIVELMAQGSFPNDDGSDGVTLCETAIEFGCCEEELFPFEDGGIVEPSAEQFANAAKHRIVGAYHGVSGSRAALSVMGDPVPWPILIGFTVYESFMSKETAKTGIVTIPEPGEELEGGHEMKLSGYDVGTTPTIRPDKCPPAVLFQNSWGPDWGDEGYGWMPIRYLDAPDTDLKIIHAGGPWKPK